MFFVIYTVSLLRFYTGKAVKFTYLHMSFQLSNSYAPHSFAFIFFNFLVYPDSSKHKKERGGSNIAQHFPKQSQKRKPVKQHQTSVNGSQGRGRNSSQSSRERTKSHPTSNRYKEPTSKNSKQAKTQTAHTEKDNGEKMHPSWLAKKNQRAGEKPVNFAGKKTTFSDDWGLPVFLPDWSWCLILKMNSLLFLESNCGNNEILSVLDVAAFQITVPQRFRQCSQQRLSKSNFVNHAICPLDGNCDTWKCLYSQQNVQYV